MKIAVVYWSGTGNTQAMAEAMADGARAAGAEVELFTVDAFSVGKMGDYQGFLFGSPAMGMEVIEESEFEPFFAEAEASLKGIPVGLFGSYGWGTGEWMEGWVQRCQNAGAKVLGQGIIANYMPDEEAIDQCKEYAAELVKSIG